MPADQVARISAVRDVVIPLPSRISGGFLVSRIDDTTCRVTHYEDDTLPPRLAPATAAVDLSAAQSDR